MARRSSGRRGGTRTITKTVRAAAPVVNVRVPAPKKVKGRRRHGGFGGSPITRMGAGAVGGFVLGFVDKQWQPTWPTIPVLGKAGTIAVAAYFVHKHMKMKIAGDVALAAATVAGYELGATGKISGDVMGGLAAQT
jgi:hypothetical protein